MCIKSRMRMLKGKEALLGTKVIFPKTAETKGFQNPPPRKLSVPEIKIKAKKLLRMLVGSLQQYMFF